MTGEDRLRARQAVSAAIRRLTGAQLRRAAPPLGVLFVYGIAGMIRYGPLASDHLFVVAGAAVSAVAMLSHGVRAILRAAGRRRRRWMGLATLGSFFPYLYGVYVTFFRGLGGMQRAWGGSAWDVLAAGVFVVLGAWLLRACWKLTEVVRLAEEMRLEGPPD